MDGKGNYWAKAGFFIYIFIHQAIDFAFAFAVCSFYSMWEAKSKPTFMPEKRFPMSLLFPQLKTDVGHLFWVSIFVPDTWQF